MELLCWKHNYRSFDAQVIRYGILRNEKLGNFRIKDYLLLLLINKAAFRAFRFVSLMLKLLYLKIYRKFQILKYERKLENFDQ